jgi:hypothetical protein
MWVQVGRIFPYPTHTEHFPASIIIIIIIIITNRQREEKACKRKKTGIQMTFSEGGGSRAEGRQLLGKLVGEQSVFIISLTHI